MLVGLVSFGKKYLNNFCNDHLIFKNLLFKGPKNCGTKDQPGVYTNVGEYMQWIDRNVR